MAWMGSMPSAPALEEAVEVDAHLVQAAVEFGQLVEQFGQLARQTDVAQQEEGEEEPEARAADAGLQARG